MSVTEALARVRGESVASRRPAGGGLSRRFLIGFAAMLSRLPRRVYLGAAVSAVLVGIAVNALTLQRGRHPAPLFAPLPAAEKPPAAVPAAHPHGLAAAPAAVAPPAPAAEKAASPPLPPASPRESAAPAARADPIADLIRGGASGPGEDARLVLEAQNALIRLGYALKADGRAGAATQQALREFERARKLPPSADITPHLVKLLTAAARDAGR